jgi:leucyl/phenylalanyl-tRNA--protein transferase
LSAKNRRIAWISASDPPEAFPHPARAMREPDGLLAAGGDLSPERLLRAYRHGIFPWYDRGQPILWWSPDPRCVIEPRSFRLARRLRRDLRKGNLTLTFNRAFAAVIDACAAPRRTGEGTWITAEMNSAYRRLHELGWAHSIEVWNGERLAGGVYGVAIDRVFFGESMFSREANASKAALFGLCRVLAQLDFELLDCQVCSPHLVSLGASAIPREDFLARLDTGCASGTAVHSLPRERMALAELAQDGPAGALQ